MIVDRSTLVKINLSMSVSNSSNNGSSGVLVLVKKISLLKKDLLSLMKPNVIGDGDEYLIGLRNHGRNVSC